MLQSSIIGSQPRRKGLALAVIVAAQFMVVLDIAIVNVALPAIKGDLHFAEGNLQWVISAYAILFGGVLLLGGRLADVFGRRRVFMIGLAVFSVSSLLCGLSWSEGSLIAFRALQGLGGALFAPAGLSILMTTFAEGAERNRALGIWGAASGSGGAAGVLLGGFLTSYLNWSWVFFINVPVGIAVITAAPLVLAESRGQGHRHFDVAGATSVTAGVMLLVYAMTRATQEGWGSFATVSLLGASLVLLAAFIAIELRSPAPLLPMQIFRNRMLSAANATAAVIGAIAFSEFFLLTLYMQQVLGYSAIQTGVAFAAVTFTIIVFSNVAQTLVTRLGVRSVLATGLTLDAVALVWFTQLPVSGHYFWNLFPAFLISGVGLALSFVPVTIAGLAGVHRADAGIASGLINTTRQVGGAVGLAAVTTIAASYASTGAGATGLARVAAVDGGLTRGFQVGFAVLAGAAVLGAVISAVMLRPRPDGAAVEPLTSPSTARLEEAA
jgi:EmrB/QacA subfamily drug resistance transporter